MKDKEFYQEVKFLFENYLTPSKDRLRLRIRNIEKNSILEDDSMNYSKVFFDSDLNIYKVDKDGRLTKVENENFETAVMLQK